jgi:hypothetical protein
VLDGQCVNPFEVDPSADISICLNAEAGHKHRSLRDWCYWHAAYQSGDTEVCDSIDWLEMRQKCRLGEDPGDYILMP